MPPPDPERPRSLAELYDRHARVAYGLALRITHDRRLAESVVEDAFLEAWRDPPTAVTYGGAERICGLVRRRALELVRDRRRSAPSVVDSDRESTAEERAAAAALARLSPRERRLLELAYFDGVTVHALAELLDLDEQTVCVQLADALHSFRTFCRA